VRLPRTGAGAALVLPACNTEAMQLTSMRSNRKSLRALTLFHPRLKGLRMAQALKVPKQHSPSCSSLNAHPNSTAKKPILAIHAAEWLSNRTVQNPSTISSNTAVRSATRVIDQHVENQVHRQPAMVSARSLNLRIGIIPIWRSTMCRYEPPQIAGLPRCAPKDGRLTDVISSPRV